MKPAAQFMRFVISGATSTVVDLLALRLALVAGIEVAAAVALAFLVGVGVNLFMHKFFTFRDSSRLHGYQVVRYLAVVGLNLALTEVVVWLSTHWIGLTPIQGKLLSLPLVVMVGFGLSRAWVFVGPARHG